MRATIRAGLLLSTVLLLLGLSAPAASAHHSRRGRHVTCATFSGKTQGHSRSDPDGMTNGGADKPGCTGGFTADRDGNNGCGNDDDREDDNNGNCGRRTTRFSAVEVRAALEAQERAVEEVEAKVVEAEKFESVRLEHVRIFFEKLANIVASLAAQVPVQPSGQVTVQAAGLVAAPMAPVPSVVLKAAAAPVTPAGAEVLGAQLERAPEAAIAPAPSAARVLGAQERRSTAGSLVRTGLAVIGIGLLGSGLVAAGRLARRAGWA